VRRRELPRNQGLPRQRIHLVDGRFGRVAEPETARLGSAEEGLCQPILAAKVRPALVESQRELLP